MTVTSYNEAIADTLLKLTQQTCVNVRQYNDSDMMMMMMMMMKRKFV